MSDLSTDFNDHSLDIAFDFSQDELRLNRDGRLSARQLRRVETAQTVNYANLGCSLLLIGVFFGGGLIIFSLVFSIQFVLESLLEWVLILIPIVALGSFMIWRANRVGATERAENNVYEITWLDGEFVLRIIQQEGQQQGVVLVHDVTFKLGWDGFTSLQKYLKMQPNGIRHRVYFEPKTQTLLSAEIWQARDI